MLVDTSTGAATVKDWTGVAVEVGGEAVSVGTAEGVGVGVA